MKGYARTAPMIAIATTFLFSSTILSQQQGSNNQKPFNLQGKWDDGGDVVDITQFGATVIAKKQKTNSCKHGGTEDSYHTEYKVTLVGNNKLEGEATYCDYGDEYARGKQWGRIEMTVSADGNTLSATQYMKDVRKDGTREVKEKFEMKRLCKPDAKGACADLAKAEKTVTTAIGATVASAASYAALKQDLSSQLNQLRNNFCNDPAALSKLDEVQHELDSLSYQSSSSNLPNNLRLVGMERGLKDLASKSCGVPACKSGEKHPSPGEEKAKDSIVDGLKKAIEQAKETAEELEGQGGTAAQEIEDLKDKIAKYEEIKGFWENITAASCVPPDVLNTIRQVANDHNASGYSENCGPLCKHTADWYMRIIPNPNPVQRKFFLETCLAYCN